MPFQVGVKHGTQTILSQAAGNVLPKPRVFPKGSPSERLWVIAEAALGKDTDKGYLFSSALGWNYQKILDSNELSRVHITSIDCFSDSEIGLLASIHKYQPPVIVALDSSSRYLFPNQGIEKALESWAGSLLISPVLNYPHYVVPTFGPEKCVSDWVERQIVQSIDIAKAKSELDYWNDNNQTLNPLPQTQLVTELEGWELISKLDNWTNNDSLEYLSVDIETIYPRDKSEFFGHPGYPIICGIAINPVWGYSFNLWPEDKGMAIKLWWKLAELFKRKKIIGQNLDQFDAKHFDMLGMPIETYEELIAAKGQSRIYDTRLRHAVLWPELKHSLQFMTRQYTRQAYYKDENCGFNPKQMQQWMRYNALDCCTTYSVFLAQEEEFNERPHLR